jgi:hypothetical protein
MVLNEEQELKGGPFGRNPDRKTSELPEVNSGRRLGQELELRASPSIGTGTQGERGRAYVDLKR